METLELPGAASHSTEPELDLLLARDGKGDWRRWRVAAIGSLLFHVFLVSGALEYHESPYIPLSPQRILVRHVTPLYTPPELTQKAPNKAKVTNELTAESIAPRPQLKAPAPAPAAKKEAAPVAQRMAPPPPPQIIQAAPRPALIEPPKIVAPSEGTQPAQIAKVQPLPSAPPPDQSKLAFEDVSPRSHTAGAGRPGGAIALPGNPIQDAIHNLSRGGAQGGQTVGDLGIDEGGLGPGLNLPPSAGRPRSNLELKSDPMGVDFRPYMLQVLLAVRRNWFAVYPEAARLGQRGQVVLQFAIAKRGLVEKVVFNGQSGARVLDQAAVAAISASNPLPPLPVEFKGDRIVLQMTFLYNMPR